MNYVGRPPALLGPSVLAGRVVQMQQHLRGDFVSVATPVIPFDDTIPQIGEGSEFFTVNITPQIVGSRLRVSAFMAGLSVTAVPSLVALALFQNPGPDAIGVGSVCVTTAGDSGTLQLRAEAEVVASSLATLTFSARVGQAGAGPTLRMNGGGAGRWFGGKFVSYLRVEEVSQDNIGGSVPASAPPVPFKMVNFSRDMTLASGNQAVVGVGFKPRAIMFFASLGPGFGNATSQSSIGYAIDGAPVAQTDVANAGNVGGSLWVVGGTKAVTLFESAAIYFEGVVASFDADGFTITWTRTGAKAGTVSVNAFCFP